MYEGRSGTGVRTPSQMSQSASPSKGSSPIRFGPGLKLGQQQPSPGKSVLKQPRDFGSDMQSTQGASKSAGGQRTVKIAGQDNDLQPKVSSGEIILAEHNQHNNQALYNITEDSDKQQIIELIMKSEENIDRLNAEMAKKMHNKGKKEKDNIKNEYKKLLQPLENNLKTQRIYLDQVTPLLDKIPDQSAFKRHRMTLLSNQMIYEKGEQKQLDEKSMFATVKRRMNSMSAIKIKNPDLDPKEEKSKRVGDRWVEKIKLE